MKDRIREIRKAAKLNQTEFGARIGVKGNTIGNYEVGLRNPSDAVIFSICREFNVNEEWLRYGTGDMFIEFPQEDEFFRAAAELSKEGDEFITAGVVEYWKLDKDGRALLKNYLLNIADRIKKEEQL